MTQPSLTSAMSCFGDSVSRPFGPPRQIVTIRSIREQLRLRGLLKATGKGRLGVSPSFA